MSSQTNLFRASFAAFAEGDSQVKNAWNIALAACFGAVVGFSVGQHVTSKGSSQALPARNAQGTIQQPSGLAAAPPGSDVVYKVTLGDAPRKGKDRKSVV